MSIEKCLMNGENSAVELGNETSVESNDVVKKFEKYRLRAELIQAEYEEARVVIDRLKEEINLSRDFEECRSLEITCLKNQVSCLEEKNKCLLTISEKQSFNEKAIQKIDERIIEINSMIQELKKKFQDKIWETEKESELIKQNKYFQSALKEKEELIQEHVSRNNQLKGEIIKLRLERDETRDYCNKTIDSYRKRLDECEKTIDELETERKRIFGDYEIKTVSQKKTESRKKRRNQDDKGFLHPGSSLTLLSDERQNVSSIKNSCKKAGTRECLPLQSQIPGLMNSNIPKMNPSKRFSKLPIDVVKQKPKIDFADEGKESSEVNPQPHPKRRLYSENDNHYLN